jgi:hypothetical protein
LIIETQKFNNLKSKIYNLPQTPYTLSDAPTRQVPTISSPS